jgi:hypothetical protein
MEDEEIARKLSLRNEDLDVNILIYAVNKDAPFTGAQRIGSKKPFLDPKLSDFPGTFCWLSYGSLLAPASFVSHCR